MQNVRLLHASLSLLLLSGGIRAYAQAPQPKIEEMQAQLNRITATDLPDFVPDAFRSARARIDELRKAAAEKGSVPEEELQRAQQDLDALQSLATRTRTSIGKAYALRNAALQSNFVRASNPAQLVRAEEDYRAALSLAAETRFGEARQRAALATRQYETLIAIARTQAKEQFGATLQRYQGAIRADLATLAAGATGTEQVAAVESIGRRIVPGNHGFDINGKGVIGWDPPPPAPPGPVPPDIYVKERGVHSVTLTWVDLSDDETGNRIVRSADEITWESVREFPAISRFTVTRQIDANLQPEHRFCYALESFNALGTRRSRSQCTYTRPEHDPAVWRLELRIKVADVNNAGTEATPSVFIDRFGPTGGVTTYVDYARQNFQRNSNDTFDLNLGEIRSLSDIVDLGLYNPDPQDILLIEELTLLVNQRVVFNQHYGATAKSVLSLGGIIDVGHDELRGGPEWQAYVQGSKTSETFDLLPLIVLDGGPAKIRIPKDQIVSRIEGMVGHTLHDQLRGQLRWGFLHGAAVEVAQIRRDAIHVDLDTEGTVDSFPNPEVDIDFDLVVAKRCEEVNLTETLLVDLKAENVTANADFAWWKDLLSAGLLPAGLAIIDACSGNAEPPSIGQTVSIPMKKAECQALDIHFDSNANLDFVQK